MIITLKGWFELKLHKRMMFILSIVTIFLIGMIVVINYRMCVPLEESLKYLLPKVFIGQRTFMLNISMGILGSIIVSLIIEIVNYIDAKRNSIISFVQKATEINTLYRNVTEAFRCTNEVDFERAIYKDILDCNTSDLYNSYHDIDFVIKKNRYSTILQEIYIEILDIKEKVESKRGKILYIDDETFENKIAPDVQKFFYKIEKLQDQNGARQVFYSDVISNKIEMVENYLFKCVWYKVEEYDLIYKMCNWKPKFIFEKIGMLILKFDIIKWSPTIHKEYVNVYTQQIYLRYVKIPFIKYKIYYKKPIKIKKNI